MKLPFRFESSKFYFALSVILVGGILGVVSALQAVKVVSDTESISNGPWQTAADYEAGNTNFWMNTATALSGLYAERQGNPVSLTAFRDSAGDRLRGGCTYYLTGNAPEAAWWSVALYGKNHRPVPNPHGIWSASMDNTSPDAAGRLQIQVGGADPGGAWIPDNGADDSGRSLTLRLHGTPDNAVPAAPLFRIDRGDCR